MCFIRSKIHEKHLQKLRFTVKEILLFYSIGRNNQTIKNKQTNNELRINKPQPNPAMQTLFSTNR